MTTEGKHPKQSGRGNSRIANSYRAIVSCPEKGFELGEHLMSKQLIVIFKNLPDLEFAEKLEAMGFDHTLDERMFTMDATMSDRAKARRLASEFIGSNQQKGR